MEADIQRDIHLGKGEVLAIPSEGIGGIGSRLIVTFRLPGWVVGSTFKEVHKGTIKMAKGLLQGNRRNRFEPGVLLLEIRQHSRKIMVGEALSMLKIGRLTSRQTPVVEEAATSKRLSKYLLLLIGWIEPILVGPLRLLAHDLFAFLLSLDILFQGSQYLTRKRAVMLLGNRFHLLQDVSRKANGERFSVCVFGIHASIVQQNWMHVKRLAPVPKPQVRNGPSIPMLESRGFTGRFDKGGMYHESIKNLIMMRSVATENPVELLPLCFLFHLRSVSSAQWPRAH